MSIENETVETATEQKVETDLSSRLQAAAWGVEMPASTEQAATTTTEQSATTVEVKSDEQTETQVSEPFYKSLGFEKEEDVINEIKTLREKKPEEIRFNDDETKRLYEAISDKTKRKEVRQILEAHEQIEELSGVVVDKDNAADIIKLQLKLKNKQLSKEEVDFEYKQNYVPPKEPVQRVTETEDEFEERMQEWKEKCSIIEQKRVIAAKLAQPELSNLKSELTLPEIKTSFQAEAAPTEEDIQRHKSEVETFVKTVDSSFNDFKGFSTNVKDKDVDFTVGYDLSDDEKTQVKSKIKEFADTGFNTNSLFVDLWVEKQADGTFKVNTPKMIKDLSRIIAGDKIDQKIASEAANKRIDEHLKVKKNINLGTSTGNSSTIDLNNPQVVSQKLQEAAWGKPA